MCERGITQFMICTTPGAEEKSNCESAHFTRESVRWLAANVTAIHEVRGPKGGVNRVRCEGMPGKFETPHPQDRRA